MIKGEESLKAVPWNLLCQAQRVAIAQGNARLAESLSMLLSERGDREQQKPGMVATLPRAFFWELEGFLADQVEDSKHRLDEARRGKEDLADYFEEYNRLDALHASLVRHGRNSGIY